MTFTNVRAGHGRLQCLNRETVSSELPQNILEGVETINLHLKLDNLFVYGLRKLPVLLLCFQSVHCLKFGHSCPIIKKM